MKISISTIVLVLTALLAKSQEVTDTAGLKEVVIKAYFSDHSLLDVPASVSVINQQILQSQPPKSLLPAINTAPGVRMEERSPGSYRLSIRGSLLRSPFGIRNVKIYLDDFLLTDAGGNTYLNVLDATNVNRIEILKGPEGSIFGANSGGVVLINSGRQGLDSSFFSAGISAGSYGLVQQNLSFQEQRKDFEIVVNQAFQRSDGYRENSAMNRKSFQIIPKWKYSSSAELSSLLMYSDLQYETPGGLTLAQFQENPRLARPGTGSSPGAAEQKAAIYNRTGLLGISHSKSFTNRFKHVLSLTGSFTDFKNPFITTYELRKEKTVGLRTYIELHGRNEDSWSWQSGIEAQQTDSEKRNFNNVSGEMGERQDFIDFKAYQGFFFSRFSSRITSRLKTEMALSINYYKYGFKSIYPTVSNQETKTFKTQLMPRIALSYALAKDVVFRASASRGYSPPTIEEVRPSSRVVNTLIEPESGWNYEAGFRISALNNKVYLDAVTFSYHLKDAIVRRVDAADTEYFVNAGSTAQNGIELQLNTWLLPLKGKGVLRGLKIAESYTHSRFVFNEYIFNSSDFSGNRLTGVPEHNLVTAISLYFPLDIKLYLQHNYVSKIPLNDANTVFADRYNLLQMRLDCRIPNLRNLNLFAGLDNLLNSSYSLGNDLNAFGSRYFNPAPMANVYGGMKILF